MRVIEIDFHRYLVEDAIRVAESVVNYARLHGERVTCRFITGRGKIQKELIALFKETYELDPIIPMANTGVVLVDIY